MGKTTAEKIFETHLVAEPFPGTKVLRLDAVLCHEITTPIAIDDLIRRGKDRVFDPSRIKAVVDHVTPSKDTKTATQAKILRDWARRHDIKDFFDIGATASAMPCSRERLYPPRQHGHHGRFPHLHPWCFRRLCRRRRHHRPGGRYPERGLRLPPAQDH